MSWSGWSYPHFSWQYVKQDYLAQFEQQGSSSCQNAVVDACYTMPQSKLCMVTMEEPVNQFYFQDCTFFLIVNGDHTKLKSRLKLFGAQNVANTFSAYSTRAINNSVTIMYKELTKHFAESSEFYLFLTWFSEKASNLKKDSFLLLSGSI